MRSLLWENRERHPDAFEQELRDWNPVISIPVNIQHVQDIVKEFGSAVDDIEDGKYSPAPVQRLQEKEVHNKTYATRVCRNCDGRFSCSSYREYVKTSRSRDLPRFREIFEDTGTEEDQQNRLNAGLGE